MLVAGAITLYLARPRLTLRVIPEGAEAVLIDGKKSPPFEVTTVGLWGEEVVVEAGRARMSIEARAQLKSGFQGIVKRVRSPDHVVLGGTNSFYLFERTSERTLWLATPDCLLTFQPQVEAASRLRLSVFSVPRVKHVVEISRDGSPEVVRLECEAGDGCGFLVKRVDEGFEIALNDMPDPEPAVSLGSLVHGKTVTYRGTCLSRLDNSEITVTVVAGGIPWTIR